MGVQQQILNDLLFEPHTLLLLQHMQTWSM